MSVATRIDPDDLTGRFHQSQLGLYPLHLWLNGQAWKLEQGVDYHCSTEKLRAFLYRWAKDMEHRVRTQKVPGGLVIQATDRFGDPLTP